MEPMYWMLFNEVRHALEEVRTQRYQEAEHSLEGVLLVEQFLKHYRRRDPHALRMARTLRGLLFWGYTPEGRLEWERWNEWRRSPDWVREQWRLRRTAQGVPWVEPLPWEPWEEPVP